MKIGINWNGVISRNSFPNFLKKLTIHKEMVNIFSGILTVETVTINVNSNIFEVVPSKDFASNKLL